MANFIDWSDVDVLKNVFDGVAEGTAALRPDEIDRLAEWFRDKWKQGPCPICTAERWLPNAKVSQVPNSNSLEDGTVFPVVFISCRNCGYSLPINVRLAGIRRDEDAETARDDEPEQSA